MSDATRKAMVEAIGAHAADVMEGAFLMDWLVVGYVPRFGVEEAEPNNYLLDSSSPADHVQRGLLNTGLFMLDSTSDSVEQ